MTKSGMSSNMMQEKNTLPAQGLHNKKKEETL